MVLVVTVDSNNGISFLERPQSSDAVVTQRINEIPDALWLNKNGIGSAPINSVIYWSQIDTVILFRWNRVYPADRTFKWPTNKEFVLTSFENFEGNSHDVITKEVYTKWPKE